MNKHPSLTNPITTPIIESEPLTTIDLTQLKEKANRIVEQVQQIVSNAEAELDAIETRVLELVALKLEQK